MSVLEEQRTGVRRNLSAYAELVRVPNLFTAPPDVLLGAALATLADEPVSLVALVGLAVASTLLYAAGTTLNDYFDAAVDAEERPERPIPSGRVSRSAALALGVVLLGAGVVVALAAGGWFGGVVAALLAVVIVLYDGLLKGGPAGFLAMGTTRGLNVLLGTTAAVVAAVTMPTWTLGVPVVVAGYIAAVTYMAADEAAGADRSAVAVAAVGAVLAALLALVALVTATVPDVTQGETADSVAAVVDPGLVGGVLAALAFLVVVGRVLAPAYRDPAPENVGPAVGACVLALVLLDAAFAGTAGLGWTLAIAAFLVPAVVLSRTFDVS